jgi:hypothetical protein
MAIGAMKWWKSKKMLEEGEGKKKNKEMMKKLYQ